MERLRSDNTRGPYLHDLLIMFLRRYVFAADWIDKMTVLDAGCGDGIGTIIYSMAAKEITAIDHSKEAIEKARMNRYFCPVKCAVGDLNTMKLPEVDTCIAFEVLEHLKPGNDFLKRLQADTLIFSVPLNSAGKYHLQVFSDENEAGNYLTQNGWNPLMTFTDRSPSGHLADVSFAGIARRHV